jgi:hypothetical protein
MIKSRFRVSFSLDGKNSCVHTQNIDSITEELEKLIKEKLEELKYDDFNVHDIEVDYSFVMRDNDDY